MPRGGHRPGAGRPKGQGPYQEPTKPIRIPESMVDAVLKYVKSKGYKLPLYTCAVQAGFPSPAEDYVEGRLDLNDLLIQHPAATFFVKVAGNSMINAGIYPGDTLIVDRSLPVKTGKIVIAVIDGQLTVKRFVKTRTSVQLVPENDDFLPITVGEDSELTIWGVVTTVLHAV
jgi:DNA polymerase V